MFRPPRPRSTADGETETLPFSQDAPGRVDLDAHRHEGQFDQSGVRSVSRRVVPPTIFNGRIPEEMLNVEQLDEEPCTGSMESRYYTNLLVNGVEDSQDAARTSDPTFHQGPATAKSSQGRSKNFSSDEDILLVSAWLNVGMDPIQGVDQSQGTYWRRIHEYIHANKTFESTRTEVSLMNRWSGIQHDVNVFCGCVSRIEARNQSGSRVDDKIANACALFKAEDKKQRKFALMHCWNILIIRRGGINHFFHYKLIEFIIGLHMCVPADMELRPAASATTRTASVAEST